MKLQLSFVWALMTAIIIGQFLPQLLEYDRTATLAGDWWRPWTSSFTHIQSDSIKTSHLLHNLMVLGIMIAAVSIDWPYTNTRGLIASQCASLLAFGVVLLIFNHVQWYRGLSGVLHGSWLLLGVGYIGSRETRLFGLFATIMLFAKVGVELTLNAPLAALWEMAPPYPVLIESHAFGVLAALIVAPLLRCSATKSA